VAITTSGGSDVRRRARVREVLGHPLVRRLLIIAGFAAAAWLAGAATAHASGGPDSAGLASALTPVHRVEAQVASTVHSVHPVTRESRKAGRVLALAHPDAPLHETAPEILGRVNAATQPVAGTLHRLAQPVAAATRPIDAIISETAAPAKLHHVRHHHSAVTGAPAAHRRTSECAPPAAPAEVVDAHQHRPIVAPHAPVPPVSGLFGTDAGTATGCSPGGFPTFSSASGPTWSERVFGDAGASRVTPRTAVTGQLPDHVEDPVVSPD
jgi:hypothetical protein